MSQHGKKFKAAKAKIEAHLHGLEEALKAVRGAAFAKFDETVEVSMKLGVNPKHADQMVRGAIVLPHGTGKSTRILVFAKGEKEKEATEAGADHVGGEELAKRIQSEGWLDFERVIATPDMMSVVGRLGKILGPRGLMPNPKVGTVTQDVEAAVKAAKGGQVRFRADKAGIVHCTIGKVDFDVKALQENMAALVADVVKSKPSSTKGQYLKRMSVSSTMGPGIGIDHSTIED